MEVKMISRGVEISIAGGVVETEDDSYLILHVAEYRLKYCKSQVITLNQCIFHQENCIIFIS